MREPRCRIGLERMDGSAAAGAYHPACCRRLFGSPSPPSLPYSRSDRNALAEQVVRRQMTVPGVQPMLSLRLERGSGAQKRLTLVGMEGGFLLKSPVEIYPEMPELEHMTLRMAEVMGIETAPGCLIALQDGHWALLSRRMDREGARKRHMEEMCQLTDRLTERKYCGSGERIGRALWRFCENPGFDALRLFELTVFCFLTGNADMRLKHFSLLYDPGGPGRLSPACDLLPTALLLPQDSEETARSLHGRKRRLGRPDFLALAAALQLTEKQAENSFARRASRLESARQILAKGFCCDPIKKQYSALIDERVRRLGMT